MDVNNTGRRTGPVHFDLDGLVSTTIDDEGPGIGVQLGIQLNSQLLIGRAREHEFGALDQLAEHGKKADLGRRHYLFSRPVIGDISPEQILFWWPHGILAGNTMHKQPPLQGAT